MAFIQYLIIDNMKLPLPDFYDLNLTAAEADSSGETEAGTIQRDVIRNGIVTSAWLKKLTALCKKILLDR